MPVVVGIFRDRDRALSALDELRQAGFTGDTATIVASPVAAGQAAREAAQSLERPPSHMIDLGAAMGGQAQIGFPESERIVFEERAAQGDTVLRVQTTDRGASDRAEAILLRHGADRALPGTIRD